MLINKGILRKRKKYGFLDCGFCQIVDCLTHHIPADYRKMFAIDIFFCVGLGAFVWTSTLINMLPAHYGFRKLQIFQVYIIRNLRGMPVLQAKKGFILASSSFLH